MSGILVAGRALTIAASILGASMAASSARADDAIAVTIENHVFAPAEIHVPAGKPAVLHVENKDPTAEEFDSDALKVEKVIPGGRSATVHLRALEKGSYPFIGEYHSKTAKGVVIAE